MKVMIGIIVAVLFFSLLGLKIFFPALLFSVLPHKKATVAPLLPTPAESIRELSPEERATMSGSFVNDFEGYIGSGSGSVKGTATEQKTTTPQPTVSTNAIHTATNSSAIQISISQGPEQGAAIKESDICFFITVGNDKTQWTDITIRTTFDDITTDWNPVFHYCYTKLKIGTHTFKVQAKNGKGAVSEELKRTFQKQ